jgi:hypothetical protein
VARGDVPRAIAEARRWVELEPTEDEAQHRLIELLADSGNRAEAIRQYESYERALRIDDLRPLDHTRALIEHVRQRSGPPKQPSARSPSPDPTAPPAPPVTPASAQSVSGWRTRIVTVGVPASESRGDAGALHCGVAVPQFQHRPGRE